MVVGSCKLSSSQRSSAVLVTGAEHKPTRCKTATAPIKKERSQVARMQYDLPVTGMPFVWLAGWSIR